MPKQTSILVVGIIDILPRLSMSDYADITVAANFEEATELLKQHEFGHVITDAVLDENKTGLDILRVLKHTVHPPKTAVCHPDRECRAHNDRTWKIEPSLSAHYPFAYYVQGKASDFLPRLISDCQTFA